MQLARALPALPTLPTPPWRRGLVAFAIAAAMLVAGPAFADGTMTVRGAYYKERATRVIQPMLDASFEVGEHGTAEGHFIVDAITSASTSSGAADSAFSEQRYEAGAGYGHELSWGKLRGDFRISREPDYFSIFGGAGAELELAEKNTVLSFSAGAGHDRVSNAGAQGPFSVAIEESMDTVLAAASVSQLLSPEIVVSAGYDLSYLSGFQQNPYRMLVIGSSLVAEHHPDSRTRHALSTTGKWFVRQTSTTMIGTYRFYGDSWGVRAHTPEVRALQQLGADIELGLRYRFHWQRAADFYKPSYSQEEAYVTDDEKLSGFTSHTLEGKLAMPGSVLGFGGVLGEARGELLLQYINQRNRFGDAFAAQVALTLPFSY
jgi:Protein of unknown function (DUF3570)